MMETENESKHSDINWFMFFGSYCAGMLSGFLGNNIFWVALHILLGWYYIAYKIIQKVYVWFL